jgi:hypothetical protein
MITVWDTDLSKACTHTSTRLYLILFIWLAGGCCDLLATIHELPLSVMTGACWHLLTCPTGGSYNDPHWHGTVHRALSKPMVTGAKHPHRPRVMLSSYNGFETRWDDSGGSAAPPAAGMDKEGRRPAPHRSRCVRGRAVGPPLLYTSAPGVAGFPA